MFGSTRDEDESGARPVRAAEAASVNRGGRTAGAAAEVAMAFADVPLGGDPARVAESTVAAARRLFDGVRLVLPPSPMPVAFGDPPDGLTLLLRFPAPAGEGELWTAGGRLDSAASDAVGAEVRRIWAVQREREQTREELERLRFQLAALQQVTHTLAEVREVAATERIALDFLREITLSWWAALYRRDDEGDYRFREAVMTRGEGFGASLPASAVHERVQPGGRPVRCEAAGAFGAALPDDLAVLAGFHLGETGSGLIALGGRMSGEPFGSADLALLQALVDASAIALRNADLIEHLRTQAIRDALTGCHNRRGFDEILSVEVARSRRYDRTLSLVLLDLDHFKQLNDRFGHDVGDQALRRVGHLLLTSFRTTDSACRPGGEEFALVFPETPKQEAIRLAERLRRSIQEMKAHDGQAEPVTASFGVAAYPDDARSIDALIRAADRALYRAKTEGRNRVVAACAPAGVPEA